MTGVSGSVVLDELVPFDELTAEALAADPEAPVGADAVPFGDPAPGGDAGAGASFVGSCALPSWYMPAAVGRVSGWRRVAVVAVIVLALLVIVASGLCITYGSLTVA